MRFSRMPRERQVYLLDPQKLTQEAIAVTFAKTSRSPLTFQEIANELTEEKTAQFNERWVVGYGHSSVAEHAVLHIAVENISRLAAECLESNRLASYTEKSSRYQKWGDDDFVIPSELNGHPLRSNYVAVCHHLFNVYRKALIALPPVVHMNHPQENGEQDKAFETRIQNLSIDIARFILPAASMTNVGVSINARALEYALRKMLSNPVDEVREVGKEIKAQAVKVAPILVKYAESMPYLMDTCNELSSYGRKVSSAKKKSLDWCRLVEYSPNVEEQILAAVLYRFSNLSFDDAIGKIKKMDLEEKTSLIECLLGDRGEHDEPLRELEYANFTFDLILDQGAYYELKRHRMMTQTPQPLGADLGYTIPKAIAESTMFAEYQNVMEEVKNTWQQMTDEVPGVAAYLVPNAFNRRVLVNLNLRSAFHLLQLRTAPNAHFSIRRIAQRMAEEIGKVSPLMSQFISMNKGETWDEIENRYFSKV
jgi:thymidylate synthase ThyX